MSDLDKAIGEMLQELRMDKGWKQLEIAELIGTNRASISKYETGRTQIPYDKLIKMANLYNVSVDFLCGLTKSRVQIDDLICEIKLENGTIRSDNLLSKYKSLTIHARQESIDFLEYLILKDKKTNR